MTEFEPLIVPSVILSSMLNKQTYYTTNFGWRCELILFKKHVDFVFLKIRGLNPMLGKTEESIIVFILFS